ncbi:MAG: glycosyltransferase family 2 protein [Candidatus Woesearchaeota archaeon]
MELVSVIIPTKDRLTALKKAINSIYNQTYPYTEIIVIDDGSTDDTPDFLLQESKSGNIIFFRNDISVGGGEARNIGIRNATGEYIAFLDDDDEWLPTKLEKQIPLFQDPEVGLVYSGLELNFEDYRIRYKSIPKMEGYIYDEMLIENRIGGTVTVVLRNNIAKNYLFDSTMPARQDYDFWLRICKDWNVKGVKESLVSVYAGGIKRITSDVKNYENAIQKINLKYDNEVKKLTHVQKKQRKAAQNFFLASQAIKANNLKVARKYFFASLTYQIKIKTIVSFISSFFGIRTILFLRKLK